jgi:alpha-tubulin suppressor-like RCC1 family protein
MKNIMFNLLADSGIKVRICASLIVMSLLVLATSERANAVTPWYASAGSHTVVLKPDGTVWAIGNNNYGQLGNGSTGRESNEPVQVVGLNNIVAVAAGGSYSVALQQNGTVWTWGYNGSGQLGTGTKTDSNTPVQVSGLRDVKEIAAGNSHVAVLKKDGTVWAWGSNHSGQLGNGQNGSSTTPVQVSGLESVSDITAGAFHTAALKNEGTVWTWGFNGSGQLGNGTMQSNYIPVKVDGLNSIIAITAGNNHMVALQQGGYAWAWGSNSASQLGNGSTSEGSIQPVQVSGLSGVRDISAKINHTFALMQDGTVMAWGDNGSGHWGNGNSMDGSSAPVQMRGVSSLISVAAIGNPSTLVKHEGPAFAGGNIVAVRPKIEAELITALLN